jgi:integrase
MWVDGVSRQKDLCDSAAIRRIRFHDLRHSAAALLIAQGVHPKAIQELLRHSSIQITMDVYGHLFDQVLQEALVQTGLSNEVGWALPN